MRNMKDMRGRKEFLDEIYAINKIWPPSRDGNGIAGEGNSTRNSGVDRQTAQATAAVLSCV